MQFLDDEIGLEKIRSSMTGRMLQQMTAKDWSIRVLSDESEVPYESLKKLLNGKILNPSLMSVLKIAMALDCSLDYLVLGKES